ncbi:TcpQ domain-containing protein [Pseudoalteromonas sp. MMG010]|uniref:TcpQ domain-containing protein n=1 Tax=Pseudoalteromonas sp. MMG010 TaxID=2822685 RepID=UPI001B39EFF6|nr:TcpQ domain-containing protein [Pseudoalteromonas sp. MMG010]MBQ4832842.1 TcpQ domain-containing protein [Pseudoalteromonas sp. MMG010]
MWFWIRNILLTLTLIGVAYFLIFNEDLDLSLSKDSFSIKDSTNAAAKGLSRFYTSIRNQVNDNKERDKFVLPLPTPTLNIDRVLAQRSQVVEPLPANWTGSVTARRFEINSTLKEVLSGYAHDEGIELYWYLKKDYVVKDHFRVDSNFTSALYQVGRAINDDFEHEVYTFFCYNQRAAVITELPSENLRTHCINLKAK